MLHIILVFAPAVGALIVGLFGRLLGDRTSQLVTCGLMGVSALCAIIGLITRVGEPATSVEIMRWIHVASFEVDWQLRIDALSSVMMFVVAFISFLIHVYSIGYMVHDPSKPRFMSYLSLFTFAMLMLVTSDNLIQLFFGWEGVGVASYLLIGFWYTRPSACAAAMKAFIVNRVGDFGFALGIAGTYLVFDSVQFDVIFANASNFADTRLLVFGADFGTLEIVTFLMFIGAMGKSAQLGLHTWLPDAMEGPTPVSALIHAATMVTAGVFLVARMSPIFEFAPGTLMFVTFIGASTCFFAATIGVVQNDIKRVIAYSTCSQLGYMFFACGVGAYAAGIFHLFTHAFFKALLFLCAGSVIHAMSDEQDMRKMGGLWKKIPITYATMWIGSLALAGIPIFAGYYSKDMIIESAFAAHSGIGTYAYWLGTIAAGLTGLYSFRLLFMTFHGESRADAQTQAHVHESPYVMTVPLMVLAVGATVTGFLGTSMIDPDLAFWSGSLAMPAGENILEEAHHTPFLFKILPLALGLLGIAIAYLCYMLRPGLPEMITTRVRPLHTFLYNKWYFDELYDFIFVRGAKAAGAGLWRGGDQGIIDRFGPDGVAGGAIATAKQAMRLQTGYVYHYAFVMLIGVAALVSVFLYWSQG